MTTTTTFSTVATKESALVLQPVLKGQCHRAVATTLLYRYLGINTGLGTAKRIETPLQALQSTFAEWLLVYAALEAGDDTQSILSMVKTEDLPAPFIGTSKPADVHLAASGVHVPSLVSLLGFLADWIGSTAPSYVTLTCGDTAAVTQPLFKSLDAIRVSAMSSKVPLRQAYNKGLELSSETFVSNLNNVLTRVAASHATRIVVAEGSQESQTLLLRKLFGKTSVIAPPFDLTSAYARDLSVTIPVSMELPSEDVVDAMAGVASVIVSTGPVWSAALATSPTDTVLQRIAIEATAETLVEAIQGTEAGVAELREVLGKAQLLNFGLQADVVVAAVNAAFSNRFKPPTTTPYVPSRLQVARPLNTAASSSFTLYFVPKTFEAAQAHVRAIANALSVIDVSSMDDGSTVLVNLKPTPKVLATLHDAGSHYAVKASSKPLAPMTKSLLAPLRWSIVFMREDLLAIALSSETCKALLASLWLLHERELPGAKFDDAISEKLISEVVHSGDVALQNAAAWMHGPMIEIVLPYNSMEDGRQLVSQLLQSRNAFVAEWDGVTYAGFEKPRRGIVTVTHRLTETDAALVKHKLSEPLTLNISEVSACSEPMLHGLCFTPLQVSLLHGFDQDGPLHDLLSIADTSAINSAELEETMVNDIQDIQFIMT